MHFDPESGLLRDFRQGGQLVFHRGPEPNLWRAPTDNDRGVNFNPLASFHAELWREMGLDNLKNEVRQTSILEKAPNEWEISAKGRLASFTYETIYTVFGNGSVKVNFSLNVPNQFSGYGKPAFRGGLLVILLMTTLLILIWRKLKYKWLAALLALLPAIGVFGGNGCDWLWGS